jgi:hypothetical protein
MFHTKYQQLNQVLDDRRHRGDSDDDNDDNGSDFDLRLSSMEQQQLQQQHQFKEQETTVSFTSSVSRNVMDVQNSSLFYEQNGRLLMKLPRDQVRLVMDSELQAGIVAVEQWRPKDAEAQWRQHHHGGGGRGSGTAGPASADASSQSFFETTPPLRYVMTVPDDLYRRVVSELSHELIGYGRCCHENERADIRLAIAILSAILLLMFISTLYWPTD